jgi:hypothetical protein
LAVTILTRDPQATVVDVSRAINANGGVWYVITAPRAVYSAPTPPPAANGAVGGSEGLSTGAIAGIVAAGIVAAAGVVLGALYYSGVLSGVGPRVMGAACGYVRVGERPTIHVRLVAVAP